MKKLVLLSFLVLIIGCEKDSETSEIIVNAPNKQYTLSVDTDAGGTVSTTGGVFTEGTLVNIQASPNSGYSFAGWSNGSTTNPLPITMTSDISLTATFTEIITSFTLSVSSQEGGSVNSEGGEYNEGTEVTLIASPEEGYRFIGWSNDSTEESITITLTEDITIEAQFEQIPIYTLTVSNSEGGSVDSEGGQYEEGTEVTLIATPEEGYKFMGWSNGSQEESISITLSEDVSLEAVFEVITFNLSINSSSGGQVSTIGGLYTYGSNISVEAQPDQGYIFSHWSNDSEDNPIDISIIDGDQNITAYFTTDLSIEDGFYKVYNGVVSDVYNFNFLIGNDFTIYLEVENNQIKTGFRLSSFGVIPGDSGITRLEHLGSFCTDCGKENAYGGYLGEMTDEFKKLSRSKFSMTHSETFNNNTKEHTLYAIKTQEIDGRNFFFEDGIPISRTELYNRLRERGEGFYSDPIYRDINFDNPYTILEAFVKDAARNGVDISNALTQEFILSTNDTVGSQPTATALASCNDDKIHINYENYYGDQILGTWTWGDLLVFYHELGHDILNLDHNCVSGGGMTDILTFGIACSSTSEPSETPIAYYQNNVNNSVEWFKNVARRMFQGVDQLSLNCRSSINEKINDIFE
jgi:uncharacterized repeat protein (TIGR02543 family)